MKPLLVTSATLGMALMLVGELSTTATPRLEVASAEHPAAPLADVDPNEIVQGTCVRCHSDTRLRGNLSLEEFDIAEAAENRETVERMIRKLRAGMMPPPGVRAPAADTLVRFVETLEGVMDEVASENPDPGRRTFQRLNRPEYEQAIRDLLDLEVNSADWLPLDQLRQHRRRPGDVAAPARVVPERGLRHQPHGGGRP
jgi:mono/diheme cytochrome c family protein